MQIGEFVRQQREKSGISARELSRRAGLSLSYASKIENGTIAPTTVNFGKLARVLNLSALEVGVAVYASLAGDNDDL